MANRNLAAQAAQLDNLMPRLIRRLFALNLDDPIAKLPLAQLRVCAILSDGSRTISGLAKELAISVSAATQVADRLEAAGIVERIPGVKDRRMRNLQLTDHGARITRARKRRRVRRAAAILAELPPAKREAVLRALMDLLRASGAVTPLEATVAAATLAGLER